MTLLSFLEMDADYLFLNFLLKPARPIMPDPSRSMVVGSGMGFAGSRSEKKLSWNPDPDVCLSAKKISMS